MKKPLVSIIITTRNSAKTLKSLLQSIKKQSYKTIEIVVIDNNSSDQTIEIAESFTKKVFTWGPERSAQRNFGTRKSTGKYLLMLDSDMVLTKNVVDECVKKIESDQQLKALIIPEESFGEGFWAKTKAFERYLNEGEEYFEAARFFPRKVFFEFGGYDENITGPEDWDLPQRVAKKNSIGRINKKILHNERKPTLLGLAKRKYYYGLSVHKYLKKQNLSPVNTKTVYFLRPAFYRNWSKIISHPLISLGMILMLSAETFGGGLGYLIGRFSNEK